MDANLSTQVDGNYFSVHANTGNKVRQSLSTILNHASVGIEEAGRYVELSFVAKYNSIKVDKTEQI